MGASAQPVRAMVAVATAVVLGGQRNAYPRLPGTVGGSET